MARTILSGGGANSRVVTHAKAGKQEPVSDKGNPAGVAEQGMAVNFRKEQITCGTGYQPYGPKDHTMQGPGAGRTIAKSGSQDCIRVAARRCRCLRSLCLAGETFCLSTAGTFPAELNTSRRSEDGSLQIDESNRHWSAQVSRRRSSYRHNPSNRSE